MTGFPGSPRLLKGGLVLIDPESAAVLRVIALQYNPDTLQRALQVQGAGGDGGDRSEALRLKGPPVETIKLDAEIDATDQLEFPDQNRDRGRARHPAAARGARDARLSDQRAARSRTTRWPQSGTLEIVPMEAPLDALRLEQAAHRAGARHRLQHHRGGVRPGAQPDPRQGQPRPARADGRRPRLRAQGRQPLHGLPADRRSSSPRRPRRHASRTLGIGGIP